MISSLSNSSYSLIAFIETRFGDPITSMSMNENYLIIGTMLGNITLYSHKTKNQIILAETSSENINGISFDSPLSFLIAIGDDEVTSYKYDNLLSTPTICHHKNYQSESEHIKNCDFAYIFLYNTTVFKIILQQPDENNLTIARVYSEYEIKNIKTKTALNGEIEMTNYVIPFDFNRDKFLWVEFLTDVNRNICIYNFPSGYNEISSMWKFPLLKEFGHISHAKIIINTNRLMIVRKLRVIDIRECDIHFTLLYTFEHIGDHAISMEMLLFSSNNKIVNVNNMNDNDKEQLSPIIVNRNIYESEHKIAKYNTRANNLNINKDNNLNLEDLESRDESGSTVAKDLSVVFLDIDGNINLFTDNSMKTLVNLYTLKDIKQEYKDKLLFSLGYAYLIKLFNDMIAVTTDHGCFLLRKTQE